MQPAVVENGLYVHILECTHTSTDIYPIYIYIRTDIQVLSRQSLSLGRTLVLLNRSFLPGLIINLNYLYYIVIMYLKYVDGKSSEDSC